MPRLERQARIAEAARIVSMGDYLTRKPSQLSGGQRQRVAMARAIVREPKIFLFDEPLSNLDAKLRVQMRAEIRMLHQRLGVTSVFVTHDQVEAMTLADRIVVMNVGLIEQIGTPTEIYTRPATRYVAGFVGREPMSFLDAIVAADGRSVAVQGGGSVPRAGALPPDRRGAPIVLGLRAEGVRLAAEAGQGHLTGRLAFTEELGSEAIHHVEVGGVDVLVAGAANQRHPASTVAIRVDAELVHLFDAVTGRRVDWAAD